MKKEIKKIVSEFMDEIVFLPSFSKNIKIIKRVTKNMKKIKRITKEKDLWRTPYSNPKVF